MGSLTDVERPTSFHTVTLDSLQKEKQNKPVDTNFHKKEKKKEKKYSGISKIRHN